jgi:hypothetical protein
VRHRKTRKEKIRSEERKLKGVKSERQRLLTLKQELEARIRVDKKRRNAAFHIRNLKIFRDTCNFLVPFVVCTGIVVGSGWLLGAGWPVYEDSIKKAKLKSLQIEAQGEYKRYDEEYINYSILSDTKDSSITIYTPWEEKNGNYTRIKRVYGSSAKSQEMIDAILHNDFDYIFESIGGYSEEFQQVNMIDEEPAYKVEGSIYILNTSDTISMPESENRNAWATVIEALLGLGIGGLIAYHRDFEYIYSLKEDWNEYRVKYSVLKKDLEQLKETDAKLLSLRRGGR